MSREDISMSSEPGISPFCTDHKDRLERIDQACREMSTALATLNSTLMHSLETINHTLTGIETRITALEEWRKVRLIEIERDRQHSRDLTQFRGWVVAVLTALWAAWTVMHDHVMTWWDTTSAGR